MGAKQSVSYPSHRLVRSFISAEYAGLSVEPSSMKPIAHQICRELRSHCPCSRSFTRDSDSLVRASASFWEWEVFSLSSCRGPGALFEVVTVLDSV